MNVKPGMFLSAAALLAASVLAPVVAAQAQQPPAGGSQRGTQSPTGASVTAKVGILNVRQAIVTTAEGKKASAELQSRFTPQQNELDNLRKQLEDIQKRLNDGQRTLSDEEKARLTRQGQDLQRLYQRRSEDLQEDLRLAENDVVEEIGGKMMEVLDRYARENGFTVIFDVSAQTTSVIYADNNVNVTQDIIRLYDQSHPISGSAPAAATRPQPGQTQKPPAKQPQR